MGEENSNANSNKPEVFLKKDSTLINKFHDEVTKHVEKKINKLKNKGGNSGNK